MNNIFELMNGSRKHIVIAVAADILNAAFCVAASFCLSYVLQSAMDGDWPRSALFVLGNGFFYLAAMGFEWLFTLEKNKTRENSLNKYREIVSEQIRNSSVDFDAKHYISMLNNDSVQVDAAVNTVFSVIDSFAFVVFGMAGLICLHWSILVVSALFIVITAVTTKLIQPQSERNELRRSSALESFYGRSSNLLNGFEVFRSYNRKDNLKELLIKNSSEFEESRKAINDRTKVFELLPSAISMIGQVCLFLLTLYLAGKGIMPIGNILAVGNLSGIFNNYISVLFSEIVKISGYNAVIREKCKEFEPMKIETKDIRNYDIDIKNLTYSYNDKKIIKGLNLNIKEGTKNLLIGPSGCGKSTLLKIISGSLADYGGEISVGGYEYKDLNEYNLHDVIGYVQQSPYIFDDSVKNNIELRAEFPAQRLENVCDECFVTEFCDRDHIDVEARSTRFSGGQKQRIAIARELIRDHKIILFDESFSGLDPDRVEELVSGILELPQTVIIVSHRYTNELKQRFDNVIELQ